MSIIGRMTATICVACAGLGSVHPASADPVEDFYRGKQIRMIIGHEAGGGYDTYARLVTLYMAKHMAGGPTFLPQNMPGAGSRIATNWIYTVAPRDGTVIGMAGQSMPMDQATKQQGVQFKAEEFGWIGNPSVDTMVMVSWAASGLQSLDDVKSKGGLVCGGSSGTAPTVIYPRIMKTLLGADIKLITGYSGTGNSILAMERGELNCIGALSWTLSKMSLEHYLRDRKIRIIMQIGPKKEPDVAAVAGGDVPLVGEFAHADIDRHALNVILSSVTVGRPFFAPPGIPADRLSALRSAFDKAMKDPELLADAKNKKMIINPVSGEALAGVVREVTSASPAVLKRVDELIGTASKEAKSAN
jgi:tripartite-type tricarboxylate transporter receptor subunit TctC